MGGRRESSPREVLLGAQLWEAGPMVEALEAAGLEVCAVVPRASDLHAAATRNGTHVVLIDHRLDGNPVRAIDDLTRAGRAVTFRAPVDQEVLFFAAVGAGAAGVIDTSSSMDALARAVLVVVEGGVAMPRRAEEALIGKMRTLGAPVAVGIAGSNAELTQREWEVLLQMLQERSTAEIAARQFVSQTTVRTHVASLLHKLGLPDRDALVRAVLGEIDEGDGDSDEDVDRRPA